MLIGFIRFSFFMAALHSRCRHYIFILRLFLPFFFFFFFSSPNLSHCRLDTSTYFHTWCGLTANLACRSETCCMRLTENTAHKKSPKIRHLRTIAQLCRPIYLRNKVCIDNIKTCSNISPPVFTIWGTLAL